MRTQVAVALLLFTATSAGAQAPPANPQPMPGPQATVRCAPVRPPNAEQGTRAPPGQTTGQSREPLSDRLAQSDGVMCPPSNIDPQMHKDAPAEGKTPVIPPPGSPGGDPNVRPK
jgi:hypothetical protein